MKTRLPPAMLVAAVLCFTGCANEEVEVLDSATAAAVDAPIDVGNTEIHYYMADGGSLEFVDGEARVATRSSFRSATVLGTGPIPDMEYATISASGLSDWRPLELREYDEGFWDGVFETSREAATLVVRGDEPSDFMRIEFFADSAAVASTFDEPHIDFEQPFLPGAIARSGRWSLPGSTRRAGESQYVRYTGAGNSCTGGLRPGARALGRFLVREFPGARTYQGYNCRKIRGGSGLSMHSVGRAVDVFIPVYGGQADNDLGDPVGNYLVENAERLGIQFIIWDRTKWNGSYSGRKDRYYGGAHPHHDHLHIELTPEAAERASLDLPPTDSIPEQFDGTFYDDDGTIYETAIEALADAGIFKGCSSDAPRVCPADNLTRAQLATLLVRSLPIAGTNRDFFTDDDGSIHETAINRIAAAGITNGCGSGSRYCPERSVTRGEAAIFLVRAFGLERSSNDFFDDDDGAFYESAMNDLRAAGITSGCGGSNGCGERAIRRGEVAIWLYRALELDRPTLDYTPHFVDDDGSIFEDSINRAYDMGLFRGCSSGDRPRFCPDESLTRGQIASVLVRGLGLSPSNRDAFDDDDDSIHEGSINRLAAEGLTRGCGTQTYCPDRDVSRGELAVFITRALRLPPANRDYFDDDDGTFYEDSANRIRQAGITRGCGERAFCGDDATTRAQAAALLVRAFD